MWFEPLITVCNCQRIVLSQKKSVDRSQNPEAVLLTPEFRILTSVRFPGSFAAVVPPVPIPNTAVKRCRADGSACIACARVGRCRGNLEKPALRNQRGLFILVAAALLRNGIHVRTAWDGLHRLLASA